MELLVVTFVFATTILSVPAEAGPSGYGHKTGPTGSGTGLRHKRSVASVPVDPVARPYYGKRAAQVAYQGLLEEKDHVFGKRSVAVYPEVDESNADNFLGRRAAPGPTGYGKREAARYPYKRSAAESVDVQQEMQSFVLGKREAARYPYKREAPGYPYKREAARYPYKRSAAESLEVDESNADYGLGKEEAPAYPYKAALAGPFGKRSVPADAHQDKHSFVLG